MLELPLGQGEVELPRRGVPADGGEARHVPPGDGVRVVAGQQQAGQLRHPRDQGLVRSLQRGEPSPGVIRPHSVCTLEVTRGHTREVGSGQESVVSP